MSKATETTHGLRTILFDEIRHLRSAKGNPTRSLAVANLARQIIGTARLEMDYTRFQQENGSSPTAIAASAKQRRTAR